jgi:hypothetical protein
MTPAILLSKLPASMQAAYAPIRVRKKKLSRGMGWALSSLKPKQKRIASHIERKATRIKASADTSAMTLTTWQPSAVSDGFCM